MIVVLNTMIIYKFEKMKMVK